MSDSLPPTHKDHKSVPTNEADNEKEINDTDMIHSENSQRSETIGNHPTPRENGEMSENSERTNLPPHNDKLPNINIRPANNLIERPKPNQGFHLGDDIVISNVNYDSEPETQKNNSNSSPENTNGIMLRTIPMALDVNRQSTIMLKKVSIYNPPSLVMDFIFKVEKQSYLKFQILFVKFLLPHIVATIFTYIFIRFHMYVDNICWLEDKCDCQDDITIKIYTIIRTILTYWNLILLLGYYSFFVIKELKNMISMKALMYFGFMGVILFLYIISDGVDDSTASLFSYGGGSIIAVIMIVVLFYKVHFNCYTFKEKILYQTLLLCILFSHLLAKRYVFNFVKVSLQKELGDLGKNLSQIIISIYSFIYKIVFKFLILRFSLRILKENGEYNAIIFFMRLIVCFIISINTANIYEMNLRDWGGWILIVTYCLFLFEFYTRSNIYTRAFNFVKSKIFKSKNLINSKADHDYQTIVSIKKVLSGYVLDFQFIFIPRLIMLYYFEHLIDYHSGDYSSDCSLKVSSKFLKNGEMLIFIILLNICLPIIFFLWMHKKKEILFEFRFENYNFLQRTYIIFLFHTYFEFIFQDFLTTT